ncbi:MAG: outer membrane lipid asymmetry maintenance protein MlaD [Thermodesulfobacteriota bacterium]|nr:outer membrane lipid asymmetry maintenance protein MlaD [Thermodesulfobacteriota bacterium]
MKKISLEFVVGLFVIAGFACFTYMSLQFGEFSFFSMDKSYNVVADFDSVSGLKPGAFVEMAGVKIGKVSKISLGEENLARVSMMINKHVPVTDDTIASVKTQGIIGDKYIKLIPGGSDKMLDNGGLISETESSLDLEELVSKYIFGDV